jgi:hypothetical protein
MFQFDFSFSGETHGIAICDEPRIPFIVIASHRVARMRAPNDRLREAIQEPRKRFWIASSQTLLAMTVIQTCIRSLAARRARSFEIHPPP